METYLMPEFQELFRAFPRLARKLSLQELRALKTFMDRRLVQEQGRLLQRMTSLELSRHADDTRFARVISALEQESKEGRELAAEYKRGFSKLSQVLSNKEGRFEGRYEKVLSQVSSLEEELRKERRTNMSLQEDNERKNELIGNLHKDVENLKRSSDEKSDYHSVLRECTGLHKTLMKTKLELELQRKNNDNMLKELDTMRGYNNKNQSYSDNATIPRHNYLSSNRSLPMIMPRIMPKSFEDSDIVYLQEKTSRGWAVPLYSSCSDPECRSLKDLAECRTQLVRKMEENANLTYLLAQARADNSKIHKALPDSRSIDADFYRPRDYVTRPNHVIPRIISSSVTAPKPRVSPHYVDASSLLRREKFSEQRKYETIPGTRQPTYK